MMEKQYLSEKVFINLQALFRMNFVYFLFYKTLSPMHHVLQQYNRLN